MSEEAKDIQTTEAKNQVSSYRSIFKATSLFGGVQIYQILISVIRQKFIAVLLGTTGMGIQGLFLTGTQLVQGISSLGLSQSAVRDVSEANGSRDTYRISKIVTVVRRLVWITGILGMIITFGLSPVLSKSLFGNYDYTIPFMVLSVVLLLDQVNNGQKVILQGTRRLKHLAQSSAIGATIGLFVSVPLYYLMGIRGIVPTLILNSFTSLILSWYFAQKIPIKKISISNKEVICEGQSMIKLGIAMSITGISSAFMAYVLKAFISNVGSVSDVGLYTAGFIILNTYVGMVFTAISTDYYPRLAAVNKDNVRCREVINQQGEIAILIVGPLILLCIIIMPFLIRIVYSQDFLPASDFILWAIPGVMFRASSNVLAYIFLAKADSKLYAINEFSAQIYGLIIRMLAYYFWGLVGLGFAYLIVYIIYTIQVFLISKKKYDFKFSNSFIKVFTVLLLMSMSGFVLAHLWISSWVYIPLAFLLVICSIYSVVELDKRMSIFQFLKDRKEE